MKDYHDHEWGRPLHDNRRLFELLSLEIMQAGLSWRTVLHKRTAFDRAFHNFNYRKVMKMAPALPRAFNNRKIIRNRLKLKAIINNARVVNRINQSGTDLNHYLWSFVNDRPIVNHYPTHSQVKISKQMKKAGFKFTGPVTVYSFMEASGMVNDHTMDCFLRS
ncbi:MAG: Hypothetical protein AJITA_00492 [Acetilactobacillus jinshanensis]